MRKKITYTKQNPALHSEFPDGINTDPLYNFDDKTYPHQGIVNALLKSPHTYLVNAEYENDNYNELKIFCNIWDRLEGNEEDTTLTLFSNPNMTIEERRKHRREYIATNILPVMIPKLLPSLETFVIANNQEEYDNYMAVIEAYGDLIINVSVEDIPYEPTKLEQLEADIGYLAMVLGEEL